MTVLLNCGTFGIWIESDTTIGFADEMYNQDKMEKLDKKFINAMTEQVKISANSDNKTSKWTTKAKSQHVEKLANLNVPNEYKSK